MEAFILSFFLLVFFLIFGMTSLVHKWRENQLRQFANSLDDGCFTGGIGFFSDIESVSVTGKLEGLRVALSFREAGTNRSGVRTYQKFLVDVPAPPGHFEVTKANLLNRFGRWFGVFETVLTGDDKIDGKYILKGKEDSLRDLFQYKEAEKAFDKLFNSLGFSKIILELSGDLHGETSRWTSKQRTVQSRFSAFIEIAKLCSRTPVTIERLGPKIHFAWTGGSEKMLCPYCRDNLNLVTDDLVDCNLCSTLHHKECFEEARACTVFACEGDATGLPKTKQGLKVRKRTKGESECEG